MLKSETIESYMIMYKLVEKMFIIQVENQKGERYCIMVHLFGQDLKIFTEQNTKRHKC